MKYELVLPYKIKIANKEIIFPIETVITKIQALSKIICFSTSPLETDLDWSNLNTHQIWKERCENNPSELFCYTSKGYFKWKFSENNVVGFGEIDLGKLTESDFITPIQFTEYIEKYNGKELLEVYAGNFRFVVDANTGEIYYRMESR